MSPQNIADRDGTLRLGTSTHTWSTTLWYCIYSFFIIIRWVPARATRVSGSPRSPTPVSQRRVRVSRLTPRKQGPQHAGRRTVPFCVTRGCSRTHLLYCSPRSRARLEGTARLRPHGIAALRACSGAAPRRRRRRPYCRCRASLRRFSAAGRARLRRLGLRGRQLLQLRCPELACGEQGLDAIVTMLRQLSAALTSPLTSPLAPPLAPPLSLHRLCGGALLGGHVHVDRAERRAVALPRSGQRRGGRAAPGGCRDGRSPHARPCPAVTCRVSAMQRGVGAPFGICKWRSRPHGIRGCRLLRRRHAAGFRGREGLRGRGRHRPRCCGRRGWRG